MSSLNQNPQLKTRTLNCIPMLFVELQVATSILLWDGPQPHQLNPGAGFQTEPWQSQQTKIKGACKQSSKPTKNDLKRAVSEER